MTKILNHKYENNELSFEIELNGGKKWIKGKDFKDDHSIIQEYWEECSRKAGEEKEISNWNLSQVMVPPPKEILDVLNIDNVSHALCKFDTFDTPVYVPTLFLRNAYPQMLINFYEDCILKNADQFPQSGTNSDF